MRNNILKSKNYPILIGKNSINKLTNYLRKICPNCKKIGIIVDSAVPKKFISKIKNKLKKYELHVFLINSSEKNKSLNQTTILINKLLNLNFNRSDAVIGIGGGIVGDLVGFTASIFKRGINFINVPTTLLAQVDSCIGGKTGVNSKYGKNLIGSFYNPKIVISDISFLKSLPKREILCGYAEILKHSLISDKNFFNWLKGNTKKLLSLQDRILIDAIKRSCKIKLSFTDKDFKEKKMRMVLNFGHTFAHALEANERYSNKLNHGEAVLIGMLIASKLSFSKRICSFETLREIENIYKKNNLIVKLKKYIKKKELIKSIKFMKNDKKNNDGKINLILIKKIGRTTIPGQFKYTEKYLKKTISQLF